MKKAPYLFRVRDGFLEHLHFGTRLSGPTADALAVRPATAETARFTGKAPTPTVWIFFPLEWSGCGRGDYRESPMELLQNGVPISTEFHYTGCEALKSAHPLCASGLARADGSCCLSGRQRGQASPHAFIRRPAHGLHKKSDSENWRRHAHLYPEAYERQHGPSGRLDAAHLFPAAGSPKCSIPKRPSLWRVPVWKARPARRPAVRTPASLAAPDAAETAGEVCGFNLLYSGSHYLSAQKKPAGPHARDAWHFSRKFQLGACAGGSGSRRRRLSGVVRCRLRRHYGLLRPLCERSAHSAVLEKPARPIVYNSWEGCMFDFTEAKLPAAGKLAKQLGCELFVLDDGWFGKRDSDTSSLGDYSVNAKKLPNGLKGLGEKLNAMGLQFGLWFEPESVSPDSELYRRHPDWALHDSLGRTDLLAATSCCSTLRSRTCGTISSKVSARFLIPRQFPYVKWDMNRHSCALGAKQHEFVLGLYDAAPHFLSRGRKFCLKAAHPAETGLTAGCSISPPADLVLG